MAHCEIVVVFPEKWWILPVRYVHVYQRVTLTCEIQPFQVEIDLYKQLKHPNIVSYLGNDRMRDRFYIYLEYMQGLD